MLYCINLPFYRYKTQEFIDIDSNENIDLLQNYRNFETLSFPKELHKISYISILFKKII